MPPLAEIWFCRPCSEWCEENLPDSTPRTMMDDKKANESLATEMKETVTHLPCAVGDNIESTTGTVAKAAMFKVCEK